MDLGDWEFVLKLNVVFFRENFIGIVLLVFMICLFIGIKLRLDCFLKMYFDSNSKLRNLRSLI